MAAGFGRGEDVGDPVGLVLEAGQGVGVLEGEVAGGESGLGWLGQREEGKGAC